MKSPSYTTTTAPSTPWMHTIQWYREELAAFLDKHIKRVTTSAGISLDEFAQERLGLKRGNHLSQVKSGKEKYVLSPALAMRLATALVLVEEETDELVFLVMRANSDRSSSMTPDFLHRYDLAHARKLVRKARADGIRLS